MASKKGSNGELVVNFMTYYHLFFYQSYKYMFLLCSGKTVSRFIPMDKILKPVLVECVTPVTCYWSLSLFLRGEDQLTLVFKVMPPVCFNTLSLGMLLFSHQF